jgi:hypothetical protein
VAIDSPLENLALYQYLMTAGGESSWPEVTQNWPQVLVDLLGGDTLNPDWDPSALLGAAFSKELPITLDAVLYENTVLGVNGSTQVNGELVVDYFDFTAGGAETFDYSRADRYGDVWIQWYEDTDNDPTTLELVQATVLDAVFGGDDWADTYIAVGPDLASFVTVDASNAGINDFAQAADDARAVISFMHDQFGAVEIPPPSGDAIL